MAENGKNDPAQMFQQIMQQLTQGGAPDAFDFTTEPTALPTESLSLNFDKITVSPSHRRRSQRRLLRFQQIESRSRQWSQ